MNQMEFKKSIEGATGKSESKPWKATLFQSPHLLLGVNCLEPGQAQAVHEHAGQDKFYLVQEGTGAFVVGDLRFDASEGEVVWVPAGLPHGVANHGARRLALVIGLAPAPPLKAP